MILEEALSCPGMRSFSCTQLMMSAMSILSALLTLPRYSLPSPDWPHTFCNHALWSQAILWFCHSSCACRKTHWSIYNDTRTFNPIWQLLREAFVCTILHHLDQSLSSISSSASILKPQVVHEIATKPVIICCRRSFEPPALL